MLRHSFVPRQFQFGTIIPIVKDHHGDLGSTDNYRGITISPVISKILEHALNSVFSEYLTTSKFQFGFKRNRLLLTQYTVLENPLITTVKGEVMSFAHFWMPPRLSIE